MKELEYREVLQQQIKQLMEQLFKLQERVNELEND